MTMSDQRLLEMATALGRIEGKLDEALKADRLRLDKLEGAQSRQWWVTYIITPITIFATAVAHKFGIHV